VPPLLAAAMSLLRFVAVSIALPLAAAYFSENAFLTPYKAAEAASREVQQRRLEGNVTNATDNETVNEPTESVGNSTSGNNTGNTDGNPTGGNNTQNNGGDSTNNGGNASNVNAASPSTLAPAVAMLLAAASLLTAF